MFSCRECAATPRLSRMLRNGYAASLHVLLQSTFDWCCFSPPRRFQFVETYTRTSKLIVLANALPGRRRFEIAMLWYLNMLLMCGWLHPACTFDGFAPSQGIHCNAESDKYCIYHTLYRKLENDITAAFPRIRYETNVKTLKSAIWPQLHRCIGCGACYAVWLYGDAFTKRICEIGGSTSHASYSIRHSTLWPFPILLDTHRINTLRRYSRHSHISEPESSSNSTPLHPRPSSLAYDVVWLMRMSSHVLLMIRFVVHRINGRARTFIPKRAKTSERY